MNERIIKRTTTTIEEFTREPNDGLAGVQPIPQQPPSAALAGIDRSALGGSPSRALAGVEPPAADLADLPPCGPLPAVHTTQNADGSRIEVRIARRCAQRPAVDMDDDEGDE